MTNETIQTETVTVKNSEELITRIVVSKPHRKEIRPVLSEKFGIKVTDQLIDDFLREEEAKSWTEKFGQFLMENGHLNMENTTVEVVNIIESPEISEPEFISSGLDEEISSMPDIPTEEEKAALTSEQQYKVELKTNIGRISSVTIFQEMIDEIKTRFEGTPITKDCIREVIGEVENLAESTLTKKTNAYTRYMLDAEIVKENEYQELEFL